MDILYLQLHDDRRRVLEATARKGDLPYYWKIDHVDGRHEVMHEEDMPNHWQQQVESARKFGAGL